MTVYGHLFNEGGPLMPKTPPSTITEVMMEFDDKVTAPRDLRTRAERDAWHRGVNDAIKLLVQDIRDVVGEHEVTGAPKCDKP